jgi:DnaK suppressor protein
MTVMVQRFVKRQVAAKEGKKKLTKKLTKTQRKEKAEKEKKELFFKRVEAYKQLKEIRVLSSATFSDEQLDRLRKELELQKTLLLKEHETLSRELSIELRSELEPCRSSNHHADANTERSIVTQSLVCNREKRLGKIDEALARIDNGTYGICMECSQPIALERLLSTPIADLCEQCKEEKEEKERKEGRRATGANGHHQRFNHASHASA